MRGLQSSPHLPAAVTLCVNIDLLTVDTFPYYGNLPTHQLNDKWYIVPDDDKLFVVFSLADILPIDINLIL